MIKFDSGIYRGTVVHERVRPRRHRLRYKVFSLLLDLDGLPTLSQRHKLLAYNSKALFSIHDSDHGDGQGIKAWVEKKLINAGVREASYCIKMLCYPRIFGYVFNPLTVFFCYKQDNSLGAILYEVHNTFKERHCYVLPVKENFNKVIRQSCSKELYVSPFVPMKCTYNFFVQPPGEKVRVVIREEDSDGLILAAAFSGDYMPLNAGSLLKAAVRYPLMTLKVIIGIHFEAFRLLLKGVPNFTHYPRDIKWDT